MMKICPNSLSKTIHSLQTTDSLQQNPPGSSLNFVKGLNSSTLLLESNKRDSTQKISSTVALLPDSHSNFLVNIQNSIRSAKRCHYVCPPEIDKYLSVKNQRLKKFPKFIPTIQNANIKKILRSKLKKMK